MSDSECNLKYKTNVTIFPGTQSMSQVKIAWSKPWWCFNHDPNSCTNPIVVPDALGNVVSVGFIFVPAVTPAERWKWKIIVTIKANGRRQDSERFAWAGNTEILITFLTSTYIFHILIYRLPSSKCGNFLLTQNIVNISIFLGTSWSCWFMFLIRANSVLLSDIIIKLNQINWEVGSLLSPVPDISLCKKYQLPTH